MPKVLFIFFFIVWGNGVLAQSEFAEIEANLSERKIDTSLVLDLYELGATYLSEDSTKSFEYFTFCQSNSDLLRYQHGRGLASFGLARWQSKWSQDFVESERLYLKSLAIFRKENDIQNQLIVIQRLSGLYQFTNEAPKAMNVLNEALNFNPNHHLYQATVYNSLGTIFKSSSSGYEGIQYYDKSEEFISHDIDTSSEFDYIVLSNDKNRGVIYRNNESYDTAAFYLNRSLEYSKEINDSIWIARNYNSLAILYGNLGDTTLALTTYQKSLELKRALNYKDGVVTTLSNIASIHIKSRNFKKAFECLEEAEQISNELNLLRRKVQVNHAFSEYYALTKNYKLAYQYQSDFYALNDSLISLENFQEAKKLEAIYQNKNNKILQEKLRAELDAADLREVNRSAKLKSQENYILFGTILGLILLGLIAFVIRTNLKRKKANALLVEKNDEVNEKNKKIELQKHQIQEKNQEMLDSQNYAKRIQDAILPSTSFFKENLSESFIFYQPKDVLAGDFYWMDVVEDTIIWAAADCTGHGIPGAMVSVVCHNALNKSIHELGLRDPGRILEATRESVIETFMKSGQEVKDGMDIAICSYNKKDDTLLFSGANNPLWIIRESEGDSDELTNEIGDRKLIEIKGDKQPVGLHFDKKPFVTHKVQLKAKDLLYLFSDGYADQFGGLKGKKLKNKNFKKLLLENAKKPIGKQGEILKKEFTKWKSDFEQLDDVCVIGVQF